MHDAKYFTHPKAEWQRRYEAMRGSFVERLPAKVVADRFGYTKGYVHLLRHQFRTGKLDFGEPPLEDRASRRRVTREIREKIRSWRERRLSAGEITQLLSETGFEISVRTVERILVEEGFPKLPRRTQLKIGVTVNGARVPEKSRTAVLSDHRFESAGAGVFLFAPFLHQLDIEGVVKNARPSRYQVLASGELLAFVSHAQAPWN